jgi:hypothetical protein
VNGVATFDLTGLALTTPGTYTLTATSGNLTQAIATVTVTTDFTIAVTGGTPAQSVLVLPGTAATYSFTLAPASGIYPPTITLSATGLPAGATYSFSPATVTPGSSAVKTVLTVQTVRTAAASFATGWGALTLLLLPLAASRRMRRFLRRGPLLSIAWALLSCGVLAGLMGCGAGGLFGNPQRSYTITVTGTAGAVSHSTTVTLTVQ